MLCCVALRVSLCCVVLCSVVLCRDVLCDVVLWCGVPASQSDNTTGFFKSISNKMKSFRFGWMQIEMVLQNMDLKNPVVLMCPFLYS